MTNTTDRPRTTFSLRNDLYEKVDALAEKLQQKRTSLMDALTEYALEHARAVQTIELVFDEPEATEEEPTASNNGKVDVVDDERTVEFTRTKMGYAEIVKNMKRWMLDGGLTSIELRKKFRQMFKEDPGNIQVVLDRPVRAGEIVVDRSQTPYIYALPAQQKSEDNEV